MGVRSTRNARLVAGGSRSRETVSSDTVIGASRETPETLLDPAVGGADAGGLDVDAHIPRVVARWAMPRAPISWAVPRRPAPRSERGLAVHEATTPGRSRSTNSSAVGHGNLHAGSPGAGEQTRTRVGAVDGLVSAQYTRSSTELNL